LIALLVLVALPLYLWRRPKPIPPPEVDAGPRAELADAASPDAAGASATADAGASKRVVLSDPKTIRCVPKGGGRVTVERCDHLTSLEDTLTRSIRENAACAPPMSRQFTVSFVLTVDFDRKKLHLWAGRSGSLKKRNAGDLIRCVEHAITPPDFSIVAHQYAKYEINVIAAYPASGPTGGGP